jgi:hypothetical protein
MAAFGLRLENKGGIFDKNASKAVTLGGVSVRSWEGFCFCRVARWELSNLFSLTLPLSEHEGEVVSSAELVSAPEGGGLQGAGAEKLKC